MIKIGRLSFESFAGSGGLLTVIMHSAKGEQQIDITPGEWAALVAVAELESLARRQVEADRLEISRLQLQRDEARAGLAALKNAIRLAREVSHA